MPPEIKGAVAPGFEPVLAAFETAFLGAPLMGAALAVRHRGVPVVDLWAGTADAPAGALWREDTLSVIFSCTKGLMSLLAARLVQDGRLDYEAPVAAYWPEFAVAGKDAVTVADLLAHRAGLSAPRDDVTLDEVLDWDGMVSRLATQEPLWTPGTGHAYHALTHGWLVGEVVRRVTGTSVGAAFAEFIAEPFHADAWIGLPPEHEERVARLHVTTGLTESVRTWLADLRATGTDWAARALTLGGAFPVELVGEGAGFNDPRVHGAEVPGAGGIATASALATIWSATVVPTDGVRLLDARTVTEATVVRSEGPPVFSPMEPYARWGMGFELDSAARRFVTPSGFGHSGAGGQLVFADPDAELGFAFLTNQLDGAGDMRATGIVDALRKAVTS